MKKSDIEIGNMLKDSNKNSYFIYYKTVYNKVDYLVCMDNNTKKVCVFRYRISMNDKVEIAEEKDKEIINKILMKSLYNRNIVV